ncbi:MAG: hypothetical protein WAK56_22740 [Candidatus Sulfotelmatobacter sp.]
MCGPFLLASPKHPAKITIVRNGSVVSLVSSDRNSAAVKTSGSANFFGGTMWTDFNRGDLRAMEAARSQMNDCHLIYNSDETPFTPADSIALHINFASKLLNWLARI